VYWIAIGVLIVKEQTPRVVISLGYYEGTYCIYKRHAVFHAAQSSIPLRRKVGSRSAASDPAKLIGREGQNDNKSRGVSIKGSHGAFRWCPHSRTPSASGCWPNKIERAREALLVGPWPFLIPIVRMRRLLVNVWSLVTGDVHLDSRMIIMRNNLEMLSRNGPSLGRYILLISNDTFLRRAWSLICSFLISSRQHLAMRCLRIELPSYPNVQAPFPLIVYLWRRRPDLETTVGCDWRGACRSPSLSTFNFNFLG
jgi:hypothetical protein